MIMIIEGTAATMGMTAAAIIIMTGTMVVGITMKAMDMAADTVSVSCAGPGF